MRRLAALGVALMVGLGVLTLARPAPSRAAIGGCSVSSAPKIASGQTQRSDPNACPDSRQYWAIDLKIGDGLNVDIAPAPPSVFKEPYLFDVYGPNVGTIGDFLCEARSGRLGCVIPASGRYVLVSYGAGSFTPMVTSVEGQNVRVPGACDPGNAPAAADRVTQYVNGRVCSPSGSAQYWRIDLKRGDTLNVNSRQIVSSGNSEPFDLRVYGPNPGALGNPLCQNTGVGPTFGFSCPIRASGRFVLEAANSGAFTPAVTHPTKVDLTVPALVKGGGAIPIRALIVSNAPNPSGTCAVQEQSGSRWVTVAKVRTTGGACNARVPATRRGTVRLRVRFTGRKGWASSTSKPRTVVVQ
jgi:hypothetical protein